MSRVLKSPLFLFLTAAAAIAGLCVCAAENERVVVKNQGFLPFADAPINYRSAQLNDPIAKLERRIERGEVVLPYQQQHGYLKSVLDALHVPVSSQALVFSKTSFQFPQITPATPRALYYNDDVYVGQVHDGKFLEFVSFDPMQGAIFYIMDERQSERPRFERAAVDCVQCHVAPTTRGVPGVMLRSVFTKPSATRRPERKLISPGRTARSTSAGADGTSRPRTARKRRWRMSPSPTPSIPNNWTHPPR